MNENHHSEAVKLDYGEKTQAYREEKRSFFRGGLRRSLLLWFLALSLIPVAAVGVVGYMNAHAQFERTAEVSLKTACRRKARSIQKFFSRMLLDLRRISAKRVNYTFLEALKNGLRESHEPLGEYVKSMDWAHAQSKYGIELGLYGRDYGYHDILLIDTAGNILYSVAGESDLGTNILRGEYADTFFASACRQALETGEVTFSDFGFYGPSGNTGAGFMVSAIVNDNAETIGLMAFQISVDSINTLLKEGISPGKTALVYLIGEDLKIRSHSLPSEEANILGRPVETKQTLLWSKKHGDLEKGIDNGDDVLGDVLIYPGPLGKPVLGIYDPISVAGMSFGLIVEVERTEAFAAVYQFRNIMAALLAVMVILVFFAATRVSNRIVRPILQLSALVNNAAGGRFDQKIEIETRNEIGELARDANRMVRELREMSRRNEEQEWFRAGQIGLDHRMRGEKTPADLGRGIITFIAEHLKAQIGAIYIVDENHLLRLLGSYAYSRRKGVSNVFEFGEGLVGQAALEKESITVTDVPEDYVRVSSSLGAFPPKDIIVYPVLHNDEVKGVIELGSFRGFSETDSDFLEQVSLGIAVAIASSQSREQVQRLLRQTQGQAEELAAQQEELRQRNEELEKQTEALRLSEVRLKEQQGELQETNEELEEKSGMLERQTAKLEEQKEEIEEKNAQLTEVQKDLEDKAEDLGRSGRYKSEFLANMSHELRTPLNSILLLSGHLSGNREGRLEDDQVESLKAIHSSGTELLSLINDVLDLSKVESGKMDVEMEDVEIVSFAKAVKREFQPLAEEKGLELKLEFAEDLPETVRTDRQRLNQILKNFLSNAFKFTAEGSVKIHVFRPDAPGDTGPGGAENGSDSREFVAFSVIDTGSGVEAEKQKQIFEAFQQADGTISRKYGGTGLGLSISREIAKLLGGSIDLESTPGTGSAFTLYLPKSHDVQEQETRFPAEPSEQKPDPGTETTHVAKNGAVIEDVLDDRKNLLPDDRTLLIIEDDPVFLKAQRDMAREAGFKCLVAGDGETGLHFADYYRPSAIILDMGLPGIDGWTVMARLKENSDTRHIPVHIMSGKEVNREAFKMGAIDFLTKPVNPAALEEVFIHIRRMISKRIKDLLVVEDDEIQQELIADIVGNGDVRITFAITASEGYSQAVTGTFDCMVLDLGLPDMSGLDLLDKIRTDERLSRVPVIVFTGRELTPEENVIMDKYAQSTILKGADSAKRLLDETTLFLHRVEADLPLRQRKILKMVHDKDSILTGKKVLMVDDDMRNVFSLKKILEERGIRIVIGRNGRDGIRRLMEDPDVDLVLMDIMMPEMNGFEAMEEIRKQRRFKDLPIIALTAKAMKGDRAKCIEAGANDYLAKPVDVDRLFSMLRVWLY